MEKVIAEVFEGVTLIAALPKYNLSRKSFYDAVHSDPLLETLYASARIAQADSLADEIKKIADDESIDPHRARNRIDAYKWLASKRDPGTYGERFDFKVTQIVDINAALTAAMARASLPNRDLDQSIELQDYEVVSENNEGSTGSKPVGLEDPSKTRDAEEFLPLKKGTGV